MEANEAQELQENAEHGSKESSLRPVAFTMSVLAVTGGRDHCPRTSHTHRGGAEPEQGH